ncbi:hypothetical protein HELRODRAFT_80006, partial [Helobdella robusta]|uniref:Calponin-homology (CH) domain-containing protein n=1 Tax=Helobdella robusta TaxID=6412 RepID=T1G3W4_HELRO
DERDLVQKKTFTKWVNKHLIKVVQQRHLISDLFEDLRDGLNLITLLEVLSHRRFPRERGRMRCHMMQNVQTVLHYLNRKRIKYVNIRADEIVDGNPKLTLGLIWTFILHYQVGDVVVRGQPVTAAATDASIKEALLLWCQKMVEGYPGVKVKDFSRSWRDGLALLAILHRHRPDLVDFNRARRQPPRANLTSAFEIAEQVYGVTPLLDAEDVDVDDPDERSIITYVSFLYELFPDSTTGERSARENVSHHRRRRHRHLCYYRYFNFYFNN